MAHDLSSNDVAAAAVDRTPGHPVVVSVCITCRSVAEGEEIKPGPALIDALQAALASEATAVLVRPVQCLGVCKRPTTVAVAAPDAFTFVFGDMNPETGPAAVASFVRSYRVADYGFVPWRERPEVLRRGLVARLPPAVWSPEDGSPPP
jgi:predicted metal-binding protein